MKRKTPNDWIEVDVTHFEDDPVRRDNGLKLELLRITEALGLERTERLLRGIRRSMRPESNGLSHEGQVQATLVVREWINTNPGPVEWLEPAEAWVKTGEIIQAYLQGAR